MKYEEIKVTEIKNGVSRDIYFRTNKEYRDYEKTSGTKLLFRGEEKIYSVKQINLQVDAEINNEKKGIFNTDIIKQGRL